MARRKRRRTKRWGRIGAPKSAKRRAFLRRIGRKGKRRRRRR